MLHLVEEGVDEFVPEEVGVPWDGGVGLEDWSGVSGPRPGGVPVAVEPLKPTSWPVTGLSGKSQRDIGGFRPVGFGFLVESEENCTNIGWKPVAGPVGGQDDVDILAS